MNETTYQEAPKDWKGIAKQLGPGLIISANIVGSGELIVTTKVGADVGFILLWFIILGCIVKVIHQFDPQVTKVETFWEVSFFFNSIHVSSPCWSIFSGAPKSL